MGFSKVSVTGFTGSVNLYLLTEKEANNPPFSYSLNLKNSHLDLKLQIHEDRYNGRQHEILFWSKDDEWDSQLQ